MAKELCEVSTGDKVYFYDKSLVLLFTGSRKVLSTSVYNGGFHDDFQGVYNHDCKQGPGMPCEMLADSYVEHMRIISRRLGLDPDKFSGMGTAADMENVVVESLSYAELTVTAIVTGGIENNGGRAGDPADYYRPIEKPDQHGTINIILVLDSDMPQGTMARALVTCTEAKTAAIQELMAGSNYSRGFATGSGTDQTIIVANADSSLYLEGSGKHAKMGELIGRVVKKAVKEALYKQTGLCPQRQHDCFRRLKRFKLTQDVLWERFKNDFVLSVYKPNYLIAADNLAKNATMLTYTSLYLHLLDQVMWEQISCEELLQAGNMLLRELSSEFAVEIEPLQDASVEGALEKWQELFNKILFNELSGSYKSKNT